MKQRVQIEEGFLLRLINEALYSSLDYSKEHDAINASFKLGIAFAYEQEYSYVFRENPLKQGLVGDLHEQAYNALQSIIPVED